MSKHNIEVIEVIECLWPFLLSKIYVWLLPLNIMNENSFFQLYSSVLASYSFDHCSAFWHLLKWLMFYIQYQGHIIVTSYVYSNSLSYCGTPCLHRGHYWLIEPIRKNWEGYYYASWVAKAVHISSDHNIRFPKLAYPLMTEMINNLILF